MSVFETLTKKRRSVEQEQADAAAALRQKRDRVRRAIAGMVDGTSHDEQLLVDEYDSPDALKQDCDACRLWRKKVAARVAMETCSEELDSLRREIVSLKRSVQADAHYSNRPELIKEKIRLRTELDQKLRTHHVQPSDFLAWRKVCRKIEDINDRVDCLQFDATRSDNQLIRLTAEYEAITATADPDSELPEPMNFQLSI